MTTPTWITPSGSIGVVSNRQYFSKQLVCDAAVSYSMASGSLPTGTTINSSTGVISGLPEVSNYSSLKPVTTYTFTVSAVSGTGNTSNISLSLGLIVNSPLNQLPYAQDRVIGSGTGYQFQFQGGSIETVGGRQWRLSNGNLPPNSTLSAVGTLRVNFGQPIFPFTPEQFIKSTADRAQPGLNIEFWNSFVRQLANSVQPWDYQFTAELADNQDLVITAHTVRIIHLKPTPSMLWFQINAPYIEYDVNQWYYLVLSTLDDNITWLTDFNLGIIENGGVSEKQVQAQSTSGTRLYYTTKPQYFNTIPQGLRLQSDGLIVGRVSFKTYEDDPVNVPFGNYYEFAVRAANATYTSYADHVFGLSIERVHVKPYDDVYIRSFPSIIERKFIQSLFDDQTLFPREFLYRATDAKFGLNRDLKLLFSAGMNTRTIENYQAALVNNHATKSLLLGDIRHAVNLDNNLNITYEVVYATVFDEVIGRDSKTQLPSPPPQTIDLRPFIKNYYVSAGQSYYELKPNGLENMRRVLESSIGIANHAAIPTWMRCLQPTDEPGIFLAPLGFFPCVVLAYTLPGRSSLMATLLRDINLNLARYEFDRYQLNLGSTSYNISANSYSVTSKTTFDNENTVFDLNSTRIVDNMDYYRAPNEGDKYLKFPRIGVFK